MFENHHQNHHHGGWEHHHNHHNEGWGNGWDTTIIMMGEVGDIIITMENGIMVGDIIIIIIMVMVWFDIVKSLF